MAGVQKEIWKPEVIEFLEKDNEFLRHAVNADEHVVDGKIVYIPQAGTPANIVRNRATLPAQVTQRTDTTILYELDEYTSDPILLTKSDQMWLSYDKRQSIIREKLKKMREFVADDMLYNWSKNVPTANKLKTTGSSTHTATAPGATSTRKNITEADVRAAQALLNGQNVMKGDRYMLLTDDLLDQLLADLTGANKYAFKDTADEKNGVVGKLWGFNILVRSSVVVAAASGDAPKLQDAATATDDNVAALFWQKDHLERAYGDVELFENQKDATYYGDVFSCITFVGGRNRRNDNAGVGLLIADA